MITCVHEVVVLLELIEQLVGVVIQRIFEIHRQCVCTLVLILGFRCRRGMVEPGDRPFEIVDDRSKTLIVINNDSESGHHSDNMKIRT